MGIIILWQTRPKYYSLETTLLVSAIFCSMYVNLNLFICCEFKYNAQTFSFDTALTRRICSLRMCYTHRVFVSVCNKFGTFASNSRPAYEYRPIEEASPKFQRMLRRLSFAVNFRKHSQAIGNVGKAFGSICNVQKAFARRL